MILLSILDWEQVFTTYSPFQLTIPAPNDLHIFISDLMFRHKSNVLLILCKERTVCKHKMASIPNKKLCFCLISRYTSDIPTIIIATRRVANIIAIATNATVITAYTAAITAYTAAITAYTAAITAYTTAITAYTAAITAYTTAITAYTAAITNNATVLTVKVLL